MDMDMEKIITMTETVNYHSKTTHAVDSKTPVSFSIRIREVERLLVRNGNDRHENLLKQRTLDSSTTRFEIPPCFLVPGEVEICRGYVSYALSKTTIATWIQLLILPQICKDAEGKRSGFMVEYHVEAVQETYVNNGIDLNDYDSQGRRIPTEPDCPICLQGFGQSQTGIITKLRCCDHCFHRDCILTWLARNPSCPTCRDDIHNPRPKKFTPKRYLGREV